MKNAISYYYNLYPNDIHQIESNYSFLVNNEYYVLTLYKRPISDLNSIYELSEEMLKNGIYTHKFIPNKDNKIITTINNDLYVLLKLYDDMKEKVRLEDVITFSKLTPYIEKNRSLMRDNWGYLWSEKIDYFEYQVNQFGKRYPLIRESFSYFVGLAEIGISLYNSIKKDDNNIVVSHIRIACDSKLYELYNPLNFVVDYSVRDVSEYFKTQFIKGEDVFENIKKYINYSYLSNNEMIMFFIRMLYPSFYFDKYEQIIDDKAEEEELQTIIDKVDDYEILLKKIYLYLNYYFQMPEIDWLKK